jgi:Thioredoxin-like
MSRQPVMNQLGAVYLLAIAVLIALIAYPLNASAAPKADTAKTDASEPQSKPAHEPKRIKQGKDGVVVLPARDVVVHGKTVRYEPDKNTIGYWTKPDDWVSWELEITHPDAFTIEMFEACGRGSGGSHYTVEIADQKLTDQVPDTDSFRNFRTRKIGQIKIDKPGNYTLSIRVDDKPGLAVMDLRTVTLKPPKADKPEPARAEKPAPGKADDAKPQAGKPEAGKTESATAAADKWMTDLDRAKEVAAKEGKDLLINFTGLAWCGNCERLEREVLTTDKFAPAAKQFVLVRLDYPPASDYHGTLCGPIAERLPNEPPPPHVAWRTVYHVDAFPTIFLADLTGRPYATMGDDGKGPTEYLEHIRQLRKIHDKRDAGFASAAKLAGIERAKALADALKALQGGFANQTDVYNADPLVRFYRVEIDTVMRLDADGAAGLRPHFANVLKAEERRADEDVFYHELKAKFDTRGIDETLRLLDKRIAEAGSIEIRNSARRARMVSLEWASRDEEALAAARELAADESYSAEDRRFMRTRIAYDLGRIHRDDEALATYDELIAEAGSDPQQVFWYLHDKADLVLEPANRFADALDVWNAAVKLVKPDKPEWRDAQGRRMHLLARLGRADDAWAAYALLSTSKFYSPLDRAGCLADMAEMLDTQGSRAAALDAAIKAQKALNSEAMALDGAAAARVQSVIDNVTRPKPDRASETTVPGNSKP